MHFAIAVPHPLAHLTRILAAVERGASGVDPLPLDQPEPLEASQRSRSARRSDGARHTEPDPSRVECQSQGHDLSFMSLSTSRGCVPGGPRQT